MSPLRARVENRPLVFNEPTPLLEGTVADDESDDVPGEEPIGPHEVVSASWALAVAGRRHPASASLDELCPRR